MHSTNFQYDKKKVKKILAPKILHKKKLPQSLATNIAAKFHILLLNTQVLGLNCLSKIVIQKKLKSFGRQN